MDEASWCYSSSLEGFFIIFLFKEIFIYLAAPGIFYGLWDVYWGMWDPYLWSVGSSSLTRGRTHVPLHWEHEVLTPGLSGKSLEGPLVGPGFQLWFLSSPLSLLTQSPHPLPGSCGAAGDALRVALMVVQAAASFPVASSTHTLPPTS